MTPLFGSSDNTSDSSPLSQSGRKSVANTVTLVATDNKTRNMTDAELVTEIEARKANSDHLGQGEATSLIAYLRVYKKRHSFLSKVYGYTRLLGSLEQKYVPKK